VLRIKEHTPTPYPFAIFTFRLAIESIKEFGGVLGTKIDLKTRIEIKTDLVTQIGTKCLFDIQSKIGINIIKVKEIVSLGDLTPKSVTMWHKITSAQLFNML
jgi:hypothetical protein